MRQQLFDYIIWKLYFIKSCRNCEHSNLLISKNACNKCFHLSRYELSSERKKEVMTMVDGILKIVKENENNK